MTDSPGEMHFGLEEMKLLISGISLTLSEIPVCSDEFTEKLLLTLCGCRGLRGADNPCLPLCTGISVIILKTMKAFNALQAVVGSPG